MSLVFHDPVGGQDSQMMIIVSKAEDVSGGGVQSLTKAQKLQATFEIQHLLAISLRLIVGVPVKKEKSEKR